MNDCKLVQDLLPLYIDNNLSLESTEFIDAHLKECTICGESGCCKK